MSHSCIAKVQDIFVVAAKSGFLVKRISTRLIYTTVSHHRRSLSYTIHDSCSLIETPLFTFTVGGDVTKDFIIHSGVIEEHSLPLKNLMNGGMIESQTKHARLKDVDIDTFRRFSEFVYFRGYTDPLPEDWDRSNDKSDTEKQEPPRVRTGSNDEEPVDMKPEPAAEREEQSFDGWGVSPKKPRKGKISWKSKAHRIDSTPMAESEGYVAWYNAFNSDYPAPSRKAYVAKAFTVRRHKVDHSSSRYPLYEWQVPSRDDSRNFSPVLVGHAKLYVFADKYDVKNLKALVLHKIHAILDGFEAVSINLLAVIDLIGFAFDNNNTPDLDGSIDPLRGLVAHYVVGQLDLVQANSLFKDLLEQGGSFVDLFWEIVDRTILRDL